MAGRDSEGVVSVAMVLVDCSCGGVILAGVVLVGLVVVWCCLNMDERLEDVGFLKRGRGVEGCTFWVLFCWVDGKKWVLISCDSLMR